jgi:hypothetical protein
VLEELDQAGEYYWNASSNTLFFASNSTDGAAPQDGELEVILAEVLVNVSGTQTKPARSVSLIDVTIRDAGPSFLTPHELPSGGDWGLVHTAAVVAQGTVNFTLADCMMTRVDGQGVLLEGYNRNSSVLRNTMEYIGSHAIVTWGRTSPCLNSNCTRKMPHGASGPDGRGGDQPIGTLVANNVVHETGVYERHGVHFFTAMSAQSHLRANVFLNSMRASVNFQDGFGGGNWLEGNLLANAGRGRNKDEGYFNSWDRLPFITFVRNGTASTEPAMNQFSKNFIFGAYSPLLDIDTDDGASYYDVHDNVFAYGGYGSKGDFNSHDIRHYRNFYYWLPRATYSGAHGPAWANTNGWFLNNTVVLRYTHSLNASPHSLNACTPPDSLLYPLSHTLYIISYTLSTFSLIPSLHPLLHPLYILSNTLSTPSLTLSGVADPCNVPGGYASDCTGGAVGMKYGFNRILTNDLSMKVCGTATLPEWVRKGHDIGSTVGPLPALAEVIDTANELLGREL